MRVGKIRLIGTSHISPKSRKLVPAVIKKTKPAIVALELDKARLYALLAGPTRPRRPAIKDIRRIGWKGWLFGALGAWVERKLGQRVGVSPGEEMLAAVHAAKDVDARIALIDQPLEITLRRFGKALTWKEKGRLIGDLFAGVAGKGVAWNLEKVPSQKLIAKLLKQVKKRYPSMYRVLVEERNQYMATQLARLTKAFPDKKIIAVVGAGHVRELGQLVKKKLKL